VNNNKGIKGFAKHSLNIYQLRVEACTIPSLVFVYKLEPKSTFFAYQKVKAFIISLHSFPQKKGKKKMGVVVLRGLVMVMSMAIFLTYVCCKCSAGDSHFLYPSCS
jgi:hypothetical protein